MISTSIWEWCVANNAWVTCSHIPGKENVMADIASRRVNDRHKWKLNELIFQDLCHIFGTPSIDLFASRLNKQVAYFCSWKPDPEAAYFDAFSITWTIFDLCHTFPPFSLITRCLQKMRAERAKGWMVVPLWPSQPWMGMILRMLVDHPHIIMRRKDVLTHPSSVEMHPIMKHSDLWHAYCPGDTPRTGHICRGCRHHPGLLETRDSETIQAIHQKMDAIL